MDGLDHPTALFFGGIGLILAGMTTWELRSPSIPRRGLPIAPPVAIACLSVFSVAPTCTCW
jgi:predicted small integral membrane protein